MKGIEISVSTSWKVREQHFIAKRCLKHSSACLPLENLIETILKSIKIASKDIKLNGSSSTSKIYAWQMSLHCFNNF
jgi:hypothetical protein